MTHVYTICIRCTAVQLLETYIYMTSHTVYNFFVINFIFTFVYIERTIIFIFFYLFLVLD